MEELVKIKNRVRNIIRDFDDIIIPVIKLIWAFIVFSTINKSFGYTPLFSKGMFVLLVSILCALMPDSFMLFIVGTIMCVNSFVVGLETGLFFIVIFIAMYCVYLRFFPKHCYIILLAFVFSYFSIQGVLPLLIGVVAGIAGVVPAAFGIVLYYFGDVLKNLDHTIKTAEDPEKVEAFNYLKDYFKGNKELIAMIAAFAVTIIVVGVVYRLTFKYAKYVAIAAGAFVNIVAFMIVSTKVGADISMGGIFISTLLALVAVCAFQFCKGFIDYRKTERVQFEDDEYYYYVKAVPKFGEDLDKAARMRGQIKGKVIPAANSMQTKKKMLTDSANAEKLSAERKAAEATERRMRQQNAEMQGRPAGIPQKTNTSNGGGRPVATQEKPRIKTPLAATEPGETDEMLMRVAKGENPGAFTRKEVPSRANAGERVAPERRTEANGKPQVAVKAGGEKPSVKRSASQVLRNAERSANKNPNRNPNRS